MCQANPSSSINTLTYHPSTRLSEVTLSDHKRQKAPLRLQRSPTQWSLLSWDLTPVHIGAAGEPALYFLLLPVTQELDSRCRWTCWQHSKGQP